jgi:hypothetical protein
MVYHPYRGYETSKHSSFIVIWDLQWKIIESHQLEACVDLRAEMAAAIERARREGWEPEADAPFGFVFIRNGRERRLMALTPRYPHDRLPTSFNPFR